MSASLALTVRRAGKPPEDIVTSTDDLRAILDRADAATEMLAALRTLEAAADADGWPDGWGLVRDRMRAALAKATGATP